LKSHVDNAPIENLFNLMTRALLLAVTLTALLVPKTASAGLMLDANDVIPTTFSTTNLNPTRANILAYLDGAEPSYQSISALGRRLFNWSPINGEGTRPLNSSYDVIDLLNGGRNGGTLDYVGGNIFDTSIPTWLIISGGTRGFVVYDLDSVGSKGVSWDGIENLTFTNANLFRRNGLLRGISSIQIWGLSTTPPPAPGPPVVPEPTTLAIWSVLGIGGLVSRRRNRSKQS
jgi:hypothetical protein